MSSVDDDRDVAQLLQETRKIDALEDAEDLAALEHRLFRREIEPVRLARYVLLERLASGGFGTVYVGYDPKLERKVAIKLLHRSGSAGRSGGGQEALLSEAQAMARFTHPNVVAVHDVGTFDASEASPLHVLGPNGQGSGPGTFIVMELVDGQTLRRWLDEPRPTEDILRVFSQAGEGLAAAHAVGLIHGDFKPENVLVGEDDRVRIVDFGLARDQPLTTRRESLGKEIMGTPAYMAPELLEGAPADAKSDQYAFAVALREALGGPEEHSTSSDGRRSSRSTASRRASAVPRQLRDALERSLSADPGRRFPSLRPLLDALSGRRARRRERWLAGAGAVALLGGVAVAATALGREDDTCDAHGRLVGVWDSAAQSRVQAQFRGSGIDDPDEVFGSVQSLLDAHAEAWSNAWTEVCRATTREADTTADLAPQVLCLERDLRRLGGLVRVLGEADGVIALRASESVLALEPPGRCVNERPTAPILPSPETRPEVLALEAEIVRAGEMNRAGRIAEAVELATAAVMRAEQTDSPDTIAAARLTLGSAQRHAAQYGEASKTLRAALKAAEQAGSSELAIRCLAGLVRVHADEGRTDLAEGVLVAGMARLARHDMSDAGAAEFLFQAGVLRMTQGRPEDSASLLRDGLARASEVYGPDHPRTANFRNSLGNAFKDAGRHEEALKEIESALETWAQRLGPRHVNVALALNNLGNVRIRQRAAAQAIALYKRARAIGEDGFPPTHPHRAMFDANLGDAYSWVGDTVRAIDSFSQAIKIYESRGKSSEYALASALHKRGYSLFTLGRFSEAIADLERATALHTERLGASNLTTLSSRDALAEVLSASGETERAYQLQLAVLAARADVAGSESSEVATSHQTIAETLDRMGRSTEALEHREAALAIYNKAPRQHVTALAQAQAGIAHAYLNLGRIGEALELLEPAVPQLMEGDAFHGPSAASASADLGLARTQAGRPSDGAISARLALKILDSVDGLTEAAGAPIRFTAARGLVIRDPSRARTAACRARRATGPDNRPPPTQAEIDEWFERTGLSPCGGARD